ncbi:MAG: dGTPase [Acidobacteriota bacterium]|nr:dGTPase [Acidobacteriota bacterium]
MSFEKIVTNKRRQHTKVAKTRNLAEELASDHSRIIYSPSFRRLSKKAQVFSLESNAAVRTRITHSLEVSDVGRLIAYAITKQLLDKEVISEELQLPIIYAVESACLVHDIGNPPFGHFGEMAIQKWFEANWESCYKKAENVAVAKERIKDLVKDFLHFDGNPQGLRILLRLKRDRDEYSYNLTYTTILSFIKYVRSPSEEKDGSELKKKAGYFESERKIVEDMKVELGLSKDARFPLAYIMEAADDIAYCISDIEDGIEKKIITETDFFQELKKEWDKECESVAKIDFPFSFESKTYYEEEEFFNFKIYYTQKAVERATNYFVERVDELVIGKSASLFPKDCEELKAFDCLKKVARKKLFRSAEAENAELAGLQIVSGLLEKFKPLLDCTKEQFNKLIAGKENPKEVAGQNLDVEWRLFNRLPKKYVLAYEDQLKEFAGEDFPEWYFRAHLIVDYISGMTDTFALEQYQLLSGIKIMQER